MHEFFGIIAALLVIIAYIPYLFKIIKGDVKPHPFTWLIWTITATSISFLQLSSGSGAGTYGTLTMAFFCLCVFLLSVRSKVAKIQYIDIICLVIALLGVGVWLVIKEPVVSIVLLLTVELIGFVPTLIKSWSKPYEESAALWGLSATRQTMSFFAVQHYNVITLLNPVVWATVGFGFFIFLLIRRATEKRPKHRVRNLRPHGS